MTAAAGNGTHRFRVVAWWASGQTGYAKSSSAPNAIHFAAPPEFGGLDGRWTPEDLLVCALAGCYTNTFRELAEVARLEYTDLQVEVEGELRKAQIGYELSEIRIRPILQIAKEINRETARKLLLEAHEICRVSRMVSLEQQFLPNVQVSELPVGR